MGHGFVHAMMSPEEIAEYQRLKENKVKKDKEAHINTFFQAIDSGDIQAIRKMVDEGFKVEGYFDRPGFKSSTVEGYPVFRAVKAGNLPLLRLLIERYTLSPNDGPPLFGRTPLNTAFNVLEERFILDDNASRQIYYDIIRYLIKKSDGTMSADTAKKILKNGLVFNSLPNDLKDFILNFLNQANRLKLLLNELGDPEVKQYIESYLQSASENVGKQQLN